ncbi:MAG: PQ-loop domain-containing transporter [Mycoplasma sp.]
MSIMDIIVLVFGMLSTTITSIMYLPQVIKVYKTNKTDELSLMTFMGSLTASLLWTIYAILMLINGFVLKSENPLISALPVLICNSILIILMSYIIFKKIKNDKQKKKNVAKEKQ